MQCRNFMIALYLMVVFPSQVCSIKCWSCGELDLESPKVCNSSEKRSKTCESPDSFCANLRNYHGTIVTKRCTTEDDGISAAERKKGNFCDAYSGLQMCVCNRDNCNDDSCNCEAEKEEFEPEVDETEEPEAEEKTAEPEPKGSETEAPKKPTKQRGTSKRTKASKTTKPRRTTKGTKKTKSTKLSGTKKPKATEPPGTKKPTSTNPPKSTKQTSKPTSTVPSTSKQADPKDAEKVGDGSSGNMVVVGWETVFTFVCVSVFQILH